MPAPSTAPQSTFSFTAAACPPGADHGDALSRIHTLCNENELLGRELLRCYDQLNLVFDITDHMPGLDDPAGIESTLLHRWAAMLDATDVYTVTGDTCRPLHGLSPAHAPLDLPAARVSEILATQIGRAATQQRSLLPEITPTQSRQLDGAHVLLGVLPRREQAPLVAIALRTAGQPPFDTGDVLASESVFGYAGHIISNIWMMRRLHAAAFETVLALTNAIDAKDPYTCGHSERVGWLARQLGQALGANEAQLQTLEWAGILHDVGKIGVPESILNKPGKLTAEEYEVIKRHPVLSHDVLRPVAALAPVLPAVLHHHENHDGSGYPHGLRGADIPEHARMIHIVDIFDALTSDRAYRRGHDLAGAFSILQEGAGTITDPRMTTAFVDMMQHYITGQPDDFRTRFRHLADSAGVQSVPPALATTTGMDHRRAEAHL